MRKNTITIRLLQQIHSDASCDSTFVHLVVGVYVTLSFPVKLYLFMICSVYFSGAIAPGTILPISCLKFCQQLESFLAILHHLISKRPLRSNCHHILLLTQLFLFIFIIIFNISKVHTMDF